VRKSLQVDDRGHTYLLALYGPLSFFVDFGYDGNVSMREFSEEEILESLHGSFKYRHAADSRAPDDGFRGHLLEGISEYLKRQDIESEGCCILRTEVATSRDFKEL
jgi:hypothetical protein